MPQRCHEGFSLVELVVVIVVLAILAVIAVPKFVSFSRDAKIASLKQVSAGLKVMTEGVYSKTLLQNKFKSRNVAVEINGTQINTYFGAPQEIWDNRLGNLMQGDFTYVGNGYFDFGSSAVRTYQCTEALCVIDQTPGSYVNAMIPGWGLFIFPKGYTLSDNCYAYYAFREDGNTVTFKETAAEITGC